MKTNINKICTDGSLNFGLFLYSVCFNAMQILWHGLINCYTLSYLYCS